VDSNTRSIVELAWARDLGLADDALLLPYPERVLGVRDEAIVFVTLWNHSVLLAPERVLAAAAALEPAALADASTLLALARAAEHPGARLLGRATLGFSDRYVSGADLASVVATQEQQALTDLDRRCPPDDVAEVGLSAMGWRVVALDEDDAAVAGAGFDENQHILASLGVLAVPERRGRGWGRRTAALALNEALDQGLVPQWRAPVDNAASQALSRRLGFEVVGTETTVLLGG
jgi:GNAT superfamily N-acetyltransferase